MNSGAAVGVAVPSLGADGVVSLDAVPVPLTLDAVDSVRVVSLGVVAAVDVVEVSVGAEVWELRQAHEVGGAHPLGPLTAQGVGQIQHAFQGTIWGEGKGREGREGVSHTTHTRHVAKAKLSREYPCFV